MRASKQALLYTAFWIILALLFNFGIYLYLGKEAALNFFAGYLIEKALSIDNLFVFLMLFKSFRTPAEYQVKVLFWGIFGAILLRAMMIFGGLALIHKFSWMLYIFGIFLVYAGFRMALPKSTEAGSKTISLLKRWLSISPDYENGFFFTKRNSRWLATPLFAVLLAIETADLMFALDSIPAVIAITRDPFIVLTSNIFAILGLRSLYFVLAHSLSLFKYLHYGLAAILIFVGIKMLIEPWYVIPIGVSLGVIALILLTSILWTKR